MKAYSLIVIFNFVCCFCKYTLVEIMPELKKNILNFGCRINFKYEGMLAHSSDRFYIVTKFILPLVNDLKFSTIDFDGQYNYLKKDFRCHHTSKEYISNLKVYCKKIVPFIDFYKEQIYSYNHTVHKILTNEIPLKLPNFPKERKEKRGIITALITGFIGLVYEDISSYLHNKRQTALHKVFIAMENKINIQCNKIILLEDSMVIYGIKIQKLWKN